MIRDCDARAENLKSKYEPAVGSKGRKECSGSETNTCKGRRERVDMAVCMENRGWGGRDGGG